MVVSFRDINEQSATCFHLVAIFAKMKNAGIHNTFPARIIAMNEEQEKNNFMTNINMLAHRFFIMVNTTNASRIKVHP